MGLKRIGVTALRIIKREEIQPASHLNIIFGTNGSGKTSLLEAIHVLALGRSFRTREIRNVIADGEKELTVVGRVALEKGEVAIGIRKAKGLTEIRVGGEPVKQASVLAQYIPVLVVTPASHRLIESERQYRREFVDWGVFHVEQGFHEAWRAYRTALKQRNASLKSPGQRQARFAWDKTLVEAGGVVDALRRRYIETLQGYVGEYIKELLAVGDVTLQYDPGWPGQQTFSDALAAARESDVRYGRTQYGPHRADLRIRLDGVDILHRVSRGQQKMLVYALKLAQIRHLREIKKKRTVMLLDDLTAELDSGHRDRLMALLAAESAQVFITTTDPDPVKLDQWESVKMFHVERGRIQEVAQEPA